MRKGIHFNKGHEYVAGAIASVAVGLVGGKTLVSMVSVRTAFAAETFDEKTFTESIVAQ
ncbi:hypothetical protein [Celerinatantimonas sp. MCCC 1A17872]|uniref:hypothetical protein n=1 Tax=Celerinatantimonas sp. MCCC 1A17872 TaxID=3177514 RepID=UPI0038C86023